MITKAKWNSGEANPRFVVTPLRPDRWPARALLEELYCDRGDVENRIKECQLDLYADRTSVASIRQPAAAVVRGVRLRARVRAASDGPYYSTSN